MAELVAKNIDSADIVIIGNGIAGLTAAVEARRLAPDRRVVVITEQSHPTINTPALKQFAIGKLDREQLLAYPAGTEMAQCIHVINARVEEIHARDRYVSLKGGRGFGYSDLLIATGSTPTGLPASLPGRDFDGVLSLHRLYDYLNLRRRLGEVEEAVVIGGGAHAIETVMCLLYWDIRVHWLIRGDTFLSRMLDSPASNMVLESVRRAGAQVYTETEVSGIVGRVGMVAGVITNHQQLLPCQLVLACTGTTPVTSLARHCDLPMKYKQGILVDAQLCTSVPHVYAAGDVAAIEDPQTGIYTPRAQWYAAVSQGRMAASLMTGSPPAEEPGVPWHATRLGSLSMLTVGNVLQWQDTITTLTDSSRSSYRRMAVIDDRLIGYLSLGPAQPDGLAIKRIIEEGLSIRDIKKALLKGTFDARAYLSRRRTFAAQRMMTTGKLPVTDALERRVSTTRKLQLTTTGEQPVITSASITSVHSAFAHTTQGDQQKRTRLAGAISNTDPLTMSVPAERDTDKDLQLLADPFVAEPTIESTLVKLPSAARTGRSPSGSLWSYSGPLPAVKINSQEAQNVVTGGRGSGKSTNHRARRGQFKAPSLAETEQRQTDAYPSKSLWSYSAKRRTKGQ